MLKKIIIFGIAIIFTLSIINSASAEFKACFEKGEIINFCPYKDDETCDISNGCTRCMSKYYEDTGCYVHGSWPVCNLLPPDECFTSGGDIDFDLEPPELTLVSPSPSNDSILTSRSVPIIFSLNEEATVYYQKNGDDDWSRLCSNCQSYNNKKSFLEGRNNVTFKYYDGIGNEAFQSASFFVDSKKPKINKAEPRSGLISSNFYVEFTEDNPVHLYMNMGNMNSGFPSLEIDLDSCFSPRKGRTACNIELDLEDFDDQNLIYWYELVDITGSKATTKNYSITVDETEPVINKLDYTINGRYVTFNISVTEKNFDIIEYNDYSAITPRWRTLCSSLKNNICFKRLSFTSGFHLVGIQVVDEAGNIVAQNIEFTI